MALRTKLIVNPNADLGRAWLTAADLRPIVEQFGGADWSGTVYPTHATQLAREAGEAGYELVVAVGGDGTVHEVINGLMHLPPERRPRFGVVPLGSGNDFAHALGMPRQSQQAIRQVLTSTPRGVDVGSLSDDHGRVEYFDNTVGIGFDATVTIRSRRFGYLRGFLIYFMAVLQTILLNHDAPVFEFKSDQESWREAMLMLTICNGGREGGGFAVAPQAKIDDGVLHYAGVRQVSRLMMLRLLPEVMKGTHAQFSQIRMGQLKTMEIRADRPLVIHTDGEIFSGFGTDIRQLHIQVHPGALEVMA